MDNKGKPLKVLKTEVEYKEALARAIEIFHVKDDTTEAEELTLLLALINDFQDKMTIIPTH